MWQFFARLAERLRPHRDILLFCFRFALYSVVAYVVIFALQDQVVEPFTRGIAWVSYELLRIVGASVSLNGVTLALGNFAVSIRTNCNAIYEMALYAAASLAYPASARQRFTGIGVAIVVLYVVNQVRILSLLWFGRTFPELFEVGHVYIWQVLFLLVSAALWLGWVGRVRPVT